MQFKAAEPVWVKNLIKEKNTFIGFKSTFKRTTQNSSFVLKVSGASVYRIWLNGVFLINGPARTAHGFARIDEIDITEKVSDGDNHLAIEVAGYNVNSYCYINQTPFLVAEVLENESVLIHTNRDFEAYALSQRIQKVQRYSFQRPFMEAYRLDSSSSLWRTQKSNPLECLEQETQEALEYLDRNVSIPKFLKREAQTIIKKGKTKHINLPEKPWRDRSLVKINDGKSGFPMEELDHIFSDEGQRIAYYEDSILNSKITSDQITTIEKGSYQLIDFGTNLSGSICLKAKCEEKTRLFLCFDEILHDGELNFLRNDTCNLISYDLEPGEYDLESFEPYTLKFLKIIAMQSSCMVSQISIREFACPDTDQVHFSCSDENLNSIFEAARETFQQNVVDIFMDCPSRERAGWLCDSFFMGRVEKTLTGKNLVERNFLENYLLPDSFEGVPKGMLPMCYPADHIDGNFIPNWAMWLVDELSEFKERNNDQEFIQQFKEKVYSLLHYFEGFENELGLLEKLEKWVFIEWSKANDFVQDVNFPSNMLYCHILKISAELFNDSSLKEKSKKLKQKIIEISYNGTFFIDNALRKEDKTLEISKNISETCQYYAFFFDIASKEDFPELWETISHKFGPNADLEELGVHKANAFIGNYLRLELLSRYNQSQQVIKEISDYFLFMTERTGTLWEFDSPNASCNHGFASHITHVLFRDLLGFKMDYKNKIINLEIKQFKLEKPIKWCEANIPIEGNLIKLKWREQDGKVHLKSDIPNDYTLNLLNPEDIIIS